MDNCYICGCILKEINDKKICPNHGVIEDKNIPESGGEINYIG